MGGAILGETHAQAEGGFERQLLKLKDDGLDGKEKGYLYMVVALDPIWPVTSWLPSTNGDWQNL